MEERGHEFNGGEDTRDEEGKELERMIRRWYWKIY